MSFKRINVKSYQFRSIIIRDGFDRTKVQFSLGRPRRPWMHARTGVSTLPGACCFCRLSNCFHIYPVADAPGIRIFKGILVADANFFINWHSWMSEERNPCGPPGSQRQNRHPILRCRLLRLCCCLFHQRLINWTIV